MLAAFTMNHLSMPQIDRQNLGVGVRSGRSTIEDRVEIAGEFHCGNLGIHSRNFRLTGLPFEPSL
jgi:hypothetical protein